MGRVDFHSLIFFAVFTTVKSQRSLVVVTPKPTTLSPYQVNVTCPVPKIYEMHVKANVKNRFAHTLVMSKVENLSPNLQEIKFSVVLPNTAYISKFVVEIGSTKYKAVVMEKNEAEKKYYAARNTGRSAAHVVANARDSNIFDVTVNLEPRRNTTFLLTYEELLMRWNNQYEIILNVHPGQPVHKIMLQANIHESRPIKFVSTPTLRSGFDATDPKNGVALPSQKSFKNFTFANVTFVPTIETQRQLGATLGVEEGEGLAGQLVIHYDVERDDRGGEVLLQEGYFVHFFAPENLKPLPKQAIFVLDTSYSMRGSKLKQLKQAMEGILSDLKPADTFNIVDFITDVNIHDVVQHTSVILSLRNLIRRRSFSECNQGYSRNHQIRHGKGAEFPFLWLHKHLLGTRSFLAIGRISVFRFRNNTTTNCCFPD